MEQAGTVEKAIDLLFHLHGEAQPQGVTAIGRALGVPKSSVHRLLVSLRRRGLVERDERGRYRPGVGLITLGAGVLEREPIVAAARPLLEEKAGRLGETLFLVSARAGELVVLEKAEGTGFLRAAPQVGSSLPVCATAVGKLYMALSPERFPLPELPPPTFTRSTVVDLAAIARSVTEAGERGWAANRDEWIAGLSVIAAPVLQGDLLVGAVALAAATARMEELGWERLASEVVEAADRIAARVAGEA